ncbi:MAG: DUF1802 family protein, partial [Isosphaeraceae bacterium]
MSGPVASLPPTCAIAFKEWAGVCSALAEGRQSLILRKGGVEEGPGGFVPDHRVFWLYPTTVHQAEQGLKPGCVSPDPRNGRSVAIQSLAMVEKVAWIDQIQKLWSLEDLHVWTWETVEKRFHYRRPGLWLLGV